MEITEKAEKTLTVARILIGSMALGVIFVAAMFLSRPRQEAHASSAAAYGLAMAVTAPAFILGFFLLRRHLLGRARVAAATTGPQRSENVAPLMFTQVLIGGAMAEGFGMLGAVGYSSTGQPVLLVACGLSLLALIAMFPTRNTLLRFADAARYSG